MKVAGSGAMGLDDDGDKVEVQKLHRQAEAEPEVGLAADYWPRVIGHAGGGNFRQFACTPLDQNGTRGRLYVIVRMGTAAVFDTTSNRYVHLSVTAEDANTVLEITRLGWMYTVQDCVMMRGNMLQKYSLIARMEAVAQWIRERFAWRDRTGIETEVGCPHERARCGTSVEQPYSIEIAPVARVGVYPPPRVFMPLAGPRLLLIDEGGPDGQGDGRPAAAWRTSDTSARPRRT